MKINFNLTLINLLMGLFILAQAAIILYNHFVLHPDQPIQMSEFSSLGPQVGAWLTAVKASQSESSKWISGRQVVRIYELAAKVKVDPLTFATAIFEVESLADMTKEQAQILIDRLLTHLR